jgi:hypothetical protein
VRARVLAAVLTAVTGCAVAPRAVKRPGGDDAAVVVGSASLHAPMDGIARHPWVALRPAGGREWERWEVMCCPDGDDLGTVERTNIDPLSDHGGGGGNVILHGVWRGAEAEKIIACVREQAPRYPYRHQYHGWPGPNSNTFVDWVIRACDLDVELAAPSIGKDFRGMIIGASVTAGGTGVQLETPLAGLKLGLTEGIELHILGLSFGIDLWPPAIIVPVGPGRIGFADR